MTGRIAQRLMGLVFAVAGMAGMAHGQPADSWLDSLDSAKGIVVGDMEPRFTPGGSASGETPGGADGSGGQAGGELDLDKILSLVREWIAVAEPPENAEPGYNLKYSNWAQIYGTTPSGTITVNAKPDDAGGVNYDFYLWTRYPGLPSLNHCTMEEYVLARTAQEPIDHCRGRYTAPPPVQLADYTGHPAEQARRALVDQQIKVQVQQGDPAPSGDLENTVATQQPAPGGSVRRGQIVTLTVYTDYQASQKERESIEQAINACQFDDAKQLISAINTNKARQPFSQRYDEAFEREEKTRALFSEADEFYRSCDYDDARASLSEAARTTGCDRYRTKIADAQNKVTTAAAREDKTKALFGDADRLFRQKDFGAALSSLTDAKANTKCERYVSRIDEAIAKVQDSIARPPLVSQPPVVTQPPRVAEDSPPPTTSPSYFVGVWALTPQACIGARPPVKETSRGTPETIGEAIQQGMAEAMEEVFATLKLRFAADGILYLVTPDRDAIAHGTWHVEGDVLTVAQYENNEIESQKVVEKSPDQFVILADDGERQVMYRCTDAQGALTEDLPLTQPDTAGPEICNNPAITPDAYLTGYNRLYGGGQSSIAVKGEYACVRAGVYMRITPSEFTEYQCEPDFANCRQTKITPVIKTEDNQLSTTYWTSNDDWWVKSPPAGN